MSLSFSSNCKVVANKGEDFGAVATLVAHEQGVGVGIGGIDAVVSGELTVQITEDTQNLFAPGSNVQVTFTALPPD